jgi:Rrf2 family protein
MSLRLSTKGRYGVLAVSKLASQYGKGPVPIKTIAEEEHIPLRYLEQLMVRLRRNGLLTSVRGPGGGYYLNRSPDKISLGEIIQILEGAVSVSRCVEIDNEVHCEFEESCISRGFWIKLSRTIQKILDNVTLQELIDKTWEDMDFVSLINNLETE